MHLGGGLTKEGCDKRDRRTHEAGPVSRACCIVTSFRRNVGRFGLNADTQVKSSRIWCTANSPTKDAVYPVRSEVSCSCSGLKFASITEAPMSVFGTIMAKIFGQAASAAPTSTLLRRRPALASKPQPLPLSNASVAEWHTSQRRSPEAERRCRRGFKWSCGKEQSET